MLQRQTWGYSRYLWVYYIINTLTYFSQCYNYFFDFFNFFGKTLVNLFKNTMGKNILALNTKRCTIQAWMTIGISTFSLCVSLQDENQTLGRHFSRFLIRTGVHLKSVYFIQYDYNLQSEIIPYKLTKPAETSQSLDPTSSFLSAFLSSLNARWPSR